MKLVRSVPIILATILFLTAFPGISQTAASQDACTQPLTADSVENDWTSDCLSAQREGSYALFYTFYLRQQSDVTIFLRSPVDTYLYLYSGTDTSAQYIDHSADITNTNLNSRIERTLEAGAYTIEATTSGRQRTGHFTLETTGIDHSYRPDLSDHAALTALYNTTDGDNWHDNTNWLTDAPLHEWYGVETNDYGRVIELELEYNNLSGQIPSELGNLTNLEDLELSDNDLSGQIPPEFGRLSNLDDLNLYTNQLTGTIPAELGNLTNLRDLDLGNNHLSGQIPRELGNLTYLTSLLLDENELVGAIPTELGNLHELESLFLNDNQLTGHIPSELGNLINMEDLWLHDNQLTGHIPPELGDLPELEELFLSGNQLTGCVPVSLQEALEDFAELALPFCESPDRAALVALYRATNGDNWESNDNWLTDAPLDEWYGVVANKNGQVILLDLHSNGLSGQIPPELGNLSNLEGLELGGNSLSGDIPPELGGLANLIELGLGNNKLTGEIPSGLGKLTNLIGLGLWDNQFSGTIPPELGNLTNLEDLYVGHNQLSGTIPPELGNLANLEHLSFNNNRLSGTIPSELAKLEELRTLSLHNNQLTGAIPSELARLDNLESLLLQRNQLSGKIPLELADLSNLKELHIGDNQLTGQIPPELSNLTNLELLTLGRNQLTGNIPPELSDLPNLVALWLYGNQLTGEIPPSLGNLDNAIRLDFTDNQLTGPIPSELANLTKLEELSLGGNQLTGQIPTWLGNLDYLEELYLHDNQLTGTIPPELGGLPELEELSLSGNHLTGCVPVSLEEALEDFDELDLPFCENPESAALTALYNATDGDNWHRNDNWLTDAPLDAWYGVETDDYGRVIELELDDNNLTGELPMELGNLTALEFLFIEDNSLWGELPHTLTALNRLIAIEFDDNSGLCAPPEPAFHEWLKNIEYEGHTCVRPSSPPDVREIGALTALYNATNGDNWHDSTNWLSEQPLQYWKGVSINSEGRITELWLDYNHLSGQIPSQLSDLTNLRRLYLYGNQLSGSIPPELGNLTNLRRLDLFINQLTGTIPPELGNLANLQELFIHSNQLSGAIPPELGNLANLERLSLSDNQLSGTIPPELGSLTNLEELLISTNQLSGAIPLELANLTELEWLSLGDNWLTGAIPSELGNLTNLEELYLSDNQLTGIIHPELGNLTELRRLYLRNNLLYGAIPPELANLTELDELFLAGNQLTGCIPNSLRDVDDNDFDELNLPFCESPDRAALVALYNATNGDNWHDNTNWLSGAPLHEWYGVDTDDNGRVTRLDFEGNNLTGQIPTEFGDLVMLDWVNISINRLSGELPQSLTSLTRMEYLYFDTNAGLCAPAYAAFQTWLQSIEYRGRTCGAPPPGSDEAALIALYNATDGDNWHRHDYWLTDAPLNEWYGVTTNEQGYVTRLDLHDNNLVGTIPYELGNLFETEAALRLWLGGNQLTGCIPETLRYVYASDLTRIDLPFCNNPDRDVLVAIYNATNGDKWTNNTNWLTDAPLYKWHGVNTDGRWSVHELILDDNQLAGQLPPEIGEFHAVKAIDFANNQLTGSIPPELGNLHPAPVVIDFSDNQLTGAIPPELGNLITNLYMLRLSGNQLTGCIPQALHEVENNDFAELGLPFCEEDTTPPMPPPPSECSEHITNFRTYIRTLTSDCASENRTAFGNHYARQLTFTLSQPTMVEVTSRSQFLDTHIFLFDDEGKTIVDIDDYIGKNAGFRKALQPGAYTVEVTTFRSDQTGDFSITFGRPELDALKALYESAGGAGWARKHNWLSDAPLSEWQGVQTDSEGRVTQVNLIANNLTGEIPSELQDLTHLEGLYLGRNELSGSIPAELGSLPALRVLLLSDNNLAGRIPAQLGKLENLHELYLSRNQLSGPIPATLGRLDNLHNLHLAANELSDDIPAELGNLANLRQLSMSDNSLTGSIPPQLADLDNLTHLYLWGNELTSGSFFLHLGDMDSLQFLDIGGNRLTGAQILPELEKLNNLTGIGLHDSGLTNSDLLDYMNDLQALDLEFLNLRSNNLSDPQILIGLSRITTLQRLAINDNKFSGQLPRSMTALTLMRIFYFNDNKGLCAPADAEFQNWLTSIRDFLGPNCAAVSPTATPAPASHSAKASAPESYSPEDAISEAHNLSLLESIQPGG